MRYGPLVTKPVHGIIKLEVCTLISDLASKLAFKFLGKQSVD